MAWRGLTWARLNLAGSLPSRLAGLALLTLLGEACAAGGHPGSHSKPAPAPEMLVARRLPEAAALNASSETPTRSALPPPSAIAPTRGGGGHEAPQPPGSLRLPSDAAWVESALPEPLPSGYAAWRQSGLSRIGKGYLYYLAALNDERWLLVESADDAEVRILDVEARRQLYSWPVVGLGNDRAHVVLPWSKQGKARVLVGKSDGLWLYDATSGKLLRQLALDAADEARWSADERVLMTVARAIPEQTARFRFYERSGEELRPLGELPISERVDAWALSRDNRYLARVFYPSDRVTLVDLRMGRTLLDAPAQRYVGSVEFSPDGHWLALGGEGVKLFDLGNPARRTEYTHFYNNVGALAFSPSGDLLVTTSFDGTVRFLAYDKAKNRLRLIKSLSHQRNTNVYTAVFIQAGKTLVTSGGDQTVRFWSGPSALMPSALASSPLGPSTLAPSTPAPSSPGPSALALSPASRMWRSPLEWAAGAPGSLPRIEPVPAPSAPGEHYLPARLSEPPLPSRIKPGHYACKISEAYRLRDCTVEVDPHGHTTLEFHKENLLGIRGVLYDDGPVVRFEGWLTEGGVLGCPTCVREPLHAVFRGSGRAWRGLLLYRGHFDPLVPVDAPEPDVRIEEAVDRFPLVLTRSEPPGAVTR